MRNVVILITSLFLAAACAPPSEPNAASDAQQVKDTETVATKEVNPLDLRRTTLIVKDMEASLAFYRDALGMTVAYDQELTSPGLVRAGAADKENSSRLVLLKANDGFIGMLGLWQFLDQDQTVPAARSIDFSPGNIVLLFSSKTLDVTFPAAADVEGVAIVEPPHERRYPSDAGDIVVMVSMLSDPDGHAVELNQILSDPRRP